jgi:hypothetical protein
MAGAIVIWFPIIQFKRLIDSQFDESHCFALFY